MKYAEVEKLILDSITQRYCTLARIKVFVEKKINEEVSHDSINDVLDGMLMERKIIRVENGTITAFFAADKIPSRFWLDGTGKVGMEFKGKPIAFVDRRITKDTGERKRQAISFKSNGRKAKEFDLAEVERLALEKPTETAIAEALGIHPNTLGQRKKKDAAFAAAIVKGQSQKPEWTVEIITALAQRGLTHAQAAEEMKMSRTAFQNKLKTPEFQQAWLENHPATNKPPVEPQFTPPADTGRPRKEWDYAEVERVANECQTDSDIAEKLEIGRETLYRYRRIDKDFSDAYERGRATSEKKKYIRAKPAQIAVQPKAEEVAISQKSGISQNCDNATDSVKKEFPSDFELFTEEKAKQVDGRGKTTRNEKLGIADFVLCPPELRIDVEKEVASSAIKPPEAARAHILYLLYQTAWQRHVKGQEYVTKQINADLLNYRKNLLEMVEAVQTDKLIEGEKDWALAITMLAAIFTGFREGLIRKLTGFDKYFVEDVLVSMFDNYFFNKDGTTNIDWFDEETKGFSFIPDFLAVTGCTKRWLDENGQILYQAVDHESKKFLGDLPMKCRCGNKIALATWKENIKQVQSVFRCAECFEHKGTAVDHVPIGEPVAEESLTVEPEFLASAEPQKIEEIITKNITEFTPAKIEGDEVSITFNVAYGSYLQLLALARLEDGTTVENVLQMAVDQFLDADTYERRDAFKQDMRQELQYILTKYQDNFSPLEVKRNNLLEWLLAEIFEEEEPSEDDHAPRYIYDLKVDLMEYLGAEFLKQIRPMEN